MAAEDAELVITFGEGNVGDGTSEPMGGDVRAAELELPPTSA